MADFRSSTPSSERGPKRYWLRIGMAFVNRDGSLNVKLDAVPLTGLLQIRDQAPPHDGEPVDSATVGSSTMTERRAPSRLRKSAVMSRAPSFIAIRA